MKRKGKKDKVMTAKNTGKSNIQLSKSQLSKPFCLLTTSFKQIDFFQQTVKQMQYDIEEQVLNQRNHLAHTRIRSYVPSVFDPI
jgi:hypothetical protein